MELADKINRAKQDLSIKEHIIIDDEAFDEISSKMQYLSLHKANLNLSIDEKISHFNSYQKTRMDFLADISTSTPTMVSTKQFYSELLAEFDKNRILLDRISGIDEFRFRMLLHDCRKCNSSHAESCDLSNCNRPLNENNDFSVAIPNDIMGQHAFYIILENIIRNTAKHSKYKKKRKFITFHIEISDPDISNCSECVDLKNYYEIHIYDSTEIRVGNVLLHEDDKLFLKNHGVVENNDNMIDRARKVVATQNIYINQSLLDHEYKLRQGAWGMIEMEAAAAYLRRIPVEDIDNDEYTLDLKDVYGKSCFSIFNNVKNANILKAFIKRTNDNKQHLAYRFFMLKPKELLIVIDDFFINLLNDEQIEKLNQLTSNFIGQGIWLKYWGNVKEIRLERFINGQIYEHEILLDITIDGINKSTGILPDRIIKVAKSDKLISGLVECIDSGEICMKRFKDNVWIKYSENDIGSVYINPQTKYNFSFEKQSPDHCIYAIYDHHASEWTKMFSRFPRQYQHIEVLTSSNSLVTILRRASSMIHDKENDNREINVFSKLLDSVYSQIVVLDERIQEAAYSLNYCPEVNSNQSVKKIPFYEMYLATGVYVPKVEDFNFSTLSYKESCRKKIVQLLSKTNEISVSSLRKVNLNRIKFLVIHLGILEKILSAEGKRRSNQKEERNLIFYLIQDLINALPIENVKPIIISGRGVPFNLPRNVPFVNYSAISQYLIDNRNKLFLNELLFSTRIIKES